MKEPATAICEKLLNDLFFSDGQFDYVLAKARIERFMAEGHIGPMEYLNYLDALNHRNKSGHYRDSLIYKRAKADEDKT